MKVALPGFLACNTYALCRILLGTIFVYAAISKLGAPQDFADSIASYRLLPEAVVSVMAVGLPLFELACGIFLLTGYFCATALLSVIGMLGLFLIALLTALVRGLPVECGCFGAHSWFETNPELALLRDGVLLATALYAYRHRLTRTVEAQEGALDRRDSAAPAEMMGPTA